MPALQPNEDIRRINTSSPFKRCRTQKSISMKLTTTQTYLVHKELEKKIHLHSTGGGAFRIGQFP